MSLFQELIRPKRQPIRYGNPVGWFTYNGFSYPFGVGPTMTWQSNQMSVDANFIGYVQGIYKSDGPVFACMAVRFMLFSEARFAYRERLDGKPGRLFSGPGLAPLDRPWPNATTGDLLRTMITDADLAGNSFVARRPKNRLKRMRPDRTGIVLGTDASSSDVEEASRTASLRELDAEIAGFVYQAAPGDAHPVSLAADEVAHFAPVPDPEFGWKGMSWLTPIVNEVLGDQAATLHKLKLFENGATPNMVVKGVPAANPDQFEAWVKKFKEAHQGIANAYKTLFLSGGADATVVGKDLQQLDFKVTQGAGETRIAAAAGVPPAVVGLSEGLQGSSLNAGNYGMARRRLADGTLRPLWRDAAGSLATIIPVPDGAELWYDDSDIPFLQEDRADAAKIQQLKALNIRQLVDAGFDPATVVDAVEADDMSRLTHTGLTSAQLLPPATGDEPATE